eukprot:CAMPEP_0169407262 /NCGR_PEP_ID=MMETSP1017-20121227/58013_1 /TAXON_ID=342587 /ORGANISM="Karlodinium micrum, Strain CCMP2283" /LENGTH=78 /DNA_ID=CAMNT_0009514167 /DNA_START=243 /DNA_END=479 /DNA_ORIENTATION=-
MPTIPGWNVRVTLSFFGGADSYVVPTGADAFACAGAEAYVVPTGARALVADGADAYVVPTGTATVGSAADEYADIGMP